MRAKVFGLLLVFVLALAVNCNVNQEFMNYVNGMRGNAVNAGAYINGCENHHYFWANDFGTHELEGYANIHHGFRFRRADTSRQLYDVVRKLRFGRKSQAVEFTNEVYANGVSGVFAKTVVAIKDGGRVYARAGIGSATCAMTQMTRTETYTARRMLCNNGPTTHTRVVPRGLEPHELTLVQDHLQQQAAQTLWDIGRHHTGIGASDDSLQSLYLQECHKLRRWFREIKYEYFEMDDVPHHELPAAIRDSSYGQINDGWVHERVKQVAVQAGRTSIFHAPNNDVLYVMSINRNGANFLVRISSFRANGAMPGGA